MASRYQWKQFCQGLSNGVIGPFVQENHNDGDDSMRAYYEPDKRRVVAQMEINGANTDSNADDNLRTFWIANDVLVAIEGITIITDEQWIEFDDFDGDDEAWLRERGHS